MEDIELTPAFMSMRVIARTKDAIYVRLPRELQRDTAGCACEHCRKDPTLAKWDTLVIPFTPGHHTWTVHMPDAAVESFTAYVKRKEVA